jgi:hypothetical protein
MGRFFYAQTNPIAVRHAFNIVQLVSESSHAAKKNRGQVMPSRNLRDGMT